MRWILVNTVTQKSQSMAGKKKTNIKPLFQTIFSKKKNVIRLHMYLKKSLLTFHKLCT